MLEFENIYFLNILSTQCHYIVSKTPFVKLYFYNRLYTVLDFVLSNSSSPLKVTQNLNLFTIHYAFGMI